MLVEFLAIVIWLVGALTLGVTIFRVLSIFRYIDLEKLNLSQWRLLGSYLGKIWAITLLFLGISISVTLLLFPVRFADWHTLLALSLGLVILALLIILISERLNR